MPICPYAFPPHLSLWGALRLSKVWLRSVTRQPHGGPPCSPLCPEFSWGPSSHMCLHHTPCKGRGHTALC